LIEVHLHPSVFKKFELSGSFGCRPFKICVDPVDADQNVECSGEFGDLFGQRNVLE